MRSGNLLKSEKERPGVKTGASSMPELPVRSVVFGGEEIFGAGDGTGAKGALVGQWRKPGVRRQPLSHASRASSPYTGEPLRCFGLRPVLDAGCNRKKRESPFGVQSMLKSFQGGEPCGRLGLPCVKGAVTRSVTEGLTCAAGICLSLKKNGRA